jgi:hypothetical protein
MHKIRSLIITSLLFFSFSHAYSQESLPKFSVKDKGKGKIVISWINNYPVVKQISVQRSYDSILEYKTIATVPDPMNRNNGVVDAKAPYNKMFYRIYIQLEGGNYLFSKPQRPGRDSGLVYTNNEADTNSFVPLTVIKLKDSVLFSLNEVQLKKFRDSIVYRTKDTLYFSIRDTLVIRPFIPKDIFRPSFYVFTDKEGNISIVLPKAGEKVYLVKLFEEDNTYLFDLNKIKEPFLTLDKSNFTHAGWYKFELYEDGVLKEKNKFFLPKDVR